MATKASIKQVIRQRLRPVLPNTFILENICFKEQLDFIMDQSPWVTASCSRRAGKSIGCAVDLMKTASENPGVICLYITLTRSMAEKLVWPALLALNTEHNFGAVPNISKLSLTFTNGSTIYLSGCHHKIEVEKFRGLAVKLIYIDEVQSFPSFIHDLIDDVLAPSLMDYAGSMKFIGTPAPVGSGFFWDILQSKIYSHHSWTFFNNPFIALKSKTTHQALLERELTRRGVSIDHPSIQREWFGKWAHDTEALVCRYDHIHNHYNALPPILTEFIIGIDIGYKDADAIAVLGWNINDKKCYMVEEIVTPKQTITDLMNQVEVLYKKYNPLKMVMDEAGLGKKIGEELRKRYLLPITPADKNRKLAYIGLLNDAFTSKRLFIKNTSRFAKDSLRIEWDYDKSTPDKMVIKRDPHSDIFDAVLYAYRESLHWLSEPLKPKIDPNKNWAEYNEKAMYEAMEKREQEKYDRMKEMGQWDGISGDPFKTDAENEVSWYIQNRGK